MKLIPYSRQFISREDIKMVSRSFKEDIITTGKYVTKFENDLKKYCNSKFAISTNSATAALHLSCLALGIKKNDIVWCSANSFVASSNSALYCGAKIDFIDINLNDYNLCPEILKNKLKKTKKKYYPKVVIVTHIGGNPADMYEIHKISKEYNFKIIEDASHAFGSIYKNSRIGSCKYSSICIFSFHPIKTITTGEGGACLTNNVKLASKIKQLRSHGINRNIKSCKMHKFYYEQIELGFNYRLSDINAALGVSQLKRIKSILKKRQNIVDIYKKKLFSRDLFFSNLKKNNYSSNHLFIIRLINKRLIINQKKIIEYLLKKNILVNIHYYPIYLHPYYKKLGFYEGYCPNAERYYSSSFSIPVYEKLDIHRINYVCKCLKLIFKKFYKKFL